MCYLPKGLVLLLIVMNGGTDQFECGYYNGHAQNLFSLDSVFDVLEHQTINISSLETACFKSRKKYNKNNK